MSVTDLSVPEPLSLARDSSGSPTAQVVPALSGEGRGTHTVRWIVAIGAVGIVGLTLLLATAPPTTVYDSYSPLVGHRAPAIIGRTVTGERFDLLALRGRFVVIDFFSSWCVPCRIEQPQLVRFAQRPFDNAQLVGIIFQDSDSSAVKMLGPWVGLYPVLPDPQGLIALNYGVANPPTKYVIDPKGRIIAKIIGPVTAAGLDSFLRRASAQGL
ncbi:MAG: TlpA family protein disulfide reductase [Hyphomicrobiales bacterium]